MSTVNVQQPLYEAPSVASTLSWNTFLSRTSVSSLTRAAFSESDSLNIHGRDGLLRIVQALDIPRFRYGDIQREEVVGEGETYLVERCVVGSGVLAIKHLKINAQPNDSMLRRRLKAAILELCIMRHRPLRVHPNILEVVGYGWNQSGAEQLPYLLVQYAPYGTLRQYLQHPPTVCGVKDKEILVGDVASGLSALHLCGIIHGDIKLDNVLVVHSWDRPSKALAKLTDFGHSISIADQSDDKGGEGKRYGGTYMYNAPEVHKQAEQPISSSDLHKCDIWAFGLLVWEVFLDGREYHTELPDSFVTRDGIYTPEDCVVLMGLAKSSIPLSKRDIHGAVLRAVFALTLQWKPIQRISNLKKLPVLTQWHSLGVQGLQAELALHLDTANWTYEMFRPEKGSEIPWEDEEQIFLGLRRLCDEVEIENVDRGAVNWQLALCYHLGFGTPRDAASAVRHAGTAKKLGHPVAEAFSDSLSSRPIDVGSASYAEKVTKLLKSSPSVYEPTDLGKSFFKGDFKAVDDFLTHKAQPPILFTGNEANILHFLFMAPEKASTWLRDHRLTLIPLVDTPSRGKIEVHDQWPLEILGTPLATAISVNSIENVQELLNLGADPLAPAYFKTQFSEEDNRSVWTPIHVAVKYHCSDILQLLLQHIHLRQLDRLDPLGIALSYSSPLERVALHHEKHHDQLQQTVHIINSHSQLDACSHRGMTPITKAIDFADEHVIEAILSTQSSLAKTPLVSPHSRGTFTYPIHFAAQLASRRNTPDTVRILEVINRFSEDANGNGRLMCDNEGRTPLHMSVTGSSSRATEWLLTRDPFLLTKVDQQGKTPLHVCASTANCKLLLTHGASIEHRDQLLMTPLHTASLSGNTEIVRHLLAQKPKLDVACVYGRTPLHYAVVRGSMETVMILLEADAPLDAQDLRGDTPSHIAIATGRLSIFRIFQNQGADLFIRNKDGRNVAHVAAISNPVHRIRVQANEIDYESGEEWTGSESGDSREGIVTEEFQLDRGWRKARKMMSRHSVSTNDSENIPLPAGSSSQETILPWLESRAERTESRTIPVEALRTLVKRLQNVTHPRFSANQFIDYVLERFQEERAEDFSSSERLDEIVAKMAKATRICSMLALQSAEPNMLVGVRRFPTERFVEAVLIVVEEICHPLYKLEASRDDLKSRVERAAAHKRAPVVLNNRSTPGDSLSRERNKRWDFWPDPAISDGDETPSSTRIWPANANQSKDKKKKKKNSISSSKVLWEKSKRWLKPSQ